MPSVPPSAPGRLAHRLAFTSKASNSPAAAHSRNRRGDLPFARTARVLRSLSERVEREWSFKRGGGALERAAFFFETCGLLPAARRWLEYRMLDSLHSFIRTLAKYHRIKEILAARRAERDARKSERR
jgi:hypothetical protein